ncbi:MAG TPA: hypothetical protein PLG31_05805 [Spirochaetota bacterium]|nr:hypothetical protein [Spirochaetota bacterium]HPU87535.1 hypothetical protein [Spirochaetota bacterium]
MTAKTLIILGVLCAPACQQENLWELASKDSRREGIFVAVGESGVVITSRDGLQWTPQPSIVNTHLIGISTDRNGRWVVVGENTSTLRGVVYTSDDAGAAWMLRFTAPTCAVFRDVATSRSGAWIAVGQNFYARSTDNAATWTEYSSFDIYNITYANGMFATVGSGGTAYRFSTNDGASFTPASSAPAIASDGLVRGNSRFVACGPTVTYFYSTDADTWVPQAAGIITSNIYHLSHDGKQRVMAAAHPNPVIYFTDDDGANWTPKTLTTPTLWGIAYGEGKWVAVGFNAWAAVCLSTDGGNTWNEQQLSGTGITTPLRAVAFGYR